MSAVPYSSHGHAALTGVLISPTHHSHNHIVTVLSAIPEPTFAPNGGTFDAAQWVTVTCTPPHRVRLVRQEILTEQSVVVQSCGTYNRTQALRSHEHY